MKTLRLLVAGYLFLLGIFLQTQLTFSYTITGNVLTDLVSTDGNFMAEATASGWAATSYFYPGVVTSMCDDTFLVGGFEVLGPSTSSSNGQAFHVTYSNLPSHTQINFSFQLWVIDEWLSAQTDKFSVIFDAVTLPGFRFDYLTTGVYPSKCGVNDRNDLPKVTIEGTVIHSATAEVYFAVKSLLHRSSHYQSFGIRQVTLTFTTPATPATPANYMCLRASTVVLDTASKCTCQSDEYESPANTGTCASCYTGASPSCTACKAGFYLSSNQCLPCSASCKTCNGGSASSCTGCADGKYLLGATCPSCTNCATCVTSATNCLSCTSNRYFNSNSCPLCDISCLTCSTGGINGCLTCPTGSYLNNNNTCVGSCNYPLIKSTDGTINFCDTPCPGSFAYWDTTCVTTCPFTPATTGVTLKLCTNPCTGTDYLNFDGTCVTTCSLPYTGGTFKGRKYCSYPCTTSEFLYFNGSCASSCDLPLVTRVTAGRKYCDNPCTTGQYLYWDSSCPTTCPEPLEEYINGGVTYCNFPCSSGQYAVYNGTCSSSCKSPLKTRLLGTGVNERKFCDLNCGSSKWMYWVGVCRTYCSSPLRQTTWNSKKYCIGPCDADLPYYFPDLGECGKDCSSPRWVDNSEYYPQCALPVAEDQGGKLFYYLLNAPIRENDYTLVVLVKQMQYVRYLQMDMPPRLYKLATSRGRGFISLAFGPSMSESMKADFTKSSSLPIVFERYGLHSSFLVNFWENLMTLVIVGCLIIVFTVLERVFRASVWKTIHGIFERLAIISRFNAILLMVGIYGGDIVLYSAIEFRTFASAFFNSSTVSTSLFMAVLFLVVTAAFYGFALWMVYYTRKRRGYMLQERDKDTVAKHLVKWRAVQLFFRGFNVSSKINQYFFVLYLLRINVPMFLSAWLLDYPLIQTLFNVFLNSGILVYILAKKPLEQKVNQVQIVIFESVLLVANCCVLFIAILDAGSMGLAGVSAVVGDIIIICNDLINALLVVFMIIKCKILADSLTDLLKVSLSRGYEVWIQLLAVPLQQAGMGFEQLFEEGCMSENSLRYSGLANAARPIVHNKADKIRSNKSQVYPLIDEDPTQFTGRKDTDYMMRKGDHSYQNFAMDRSAVNAGDLTTYPLADSMMRSPAKPPLRGSPTHEVYKGSPVRAPARQQLVLDSPQRLPPRSGPQHRPSPPQRSPPRMDPEPLPQRAGPQHRGSPQQRPSPPQRSPQESPYADFQGSPGRERIKKKLSTKVRPLEDGGFEELPNTSALVINEATMASNRNKSRNPYGEGASLNEGRGETPVSLVHDDSTLNNRKPNSRQRLANRNGRSSNRIHPSEFDLENEHI